MKAFLQNSYVGIQVGLIVSSVAIAFGFLFPSWLTPLVTENCRPEEFSRDFQICDPVRPWLSGVQMFIGTTMYFLSPLWVGLVFGLIWATQKDRQFWRTFRDTIIASLVLWGALCIFEILWYQPWDTEPYNRFELNRIFTTDFGILVPFLSLFTFMLTIVLSKRLWLSFKPMGFRKPKTTV